MRIETTIDLGCQDVTVDLTKDDLSALLVELFLDTNTLPEVLRSINAFYQLMRGIPDSVIDKASEATRQAVVGGLAEMTNRWRPTPEDEGP